MCGRGVGSGRCRQRRNGQSQRHLWRHSTKVSAENGAIRRGDLLVTAAIRGHAMKAGAPATIGTVLGKALQDFAGPGTINVLVNVQ